MYFEWDNNKNKANIIKHGISFEEAAIIFKSAVITRIDSRKDYKEVREISIGMIGRQVIAAVVHTRRNKAIRIISARLANKAERRIYYDYYKKNT